MSVYLLPSATCVTLESKRPCVEGMEPENQVDVAVCDAASKGSPTDVSSRLPVASTFQRTEE